jgi:hypothetical protein
MQKQDRFIIGRHTQYDLEKYWSIHNDNRLINT